MTKVNFEEYCKRPTRDSSRGRSKSKGKGDGKGKGGKGKKRLPMVCHEFLKNQDCKYAATHDGVKCKFRHLTKKEYYAEEKELNA